MKLNTLCVGAVLILTIGFPSCTATEDLDQSKASSADNSVISFYVQTYNPTRTTGSAISYANPSNFMVGALNGELAYFETGIEIVSRTGDTDSWISNNHWPLNPPSTWDGLCFYAYMDGKTGKSTGNAAECFEISGKTTIKGFEAVAEADKQTDFMYAVAKNVKKNTKGNVTLNFRHALSIISFTAQNNNPLYEDIEILAIELGGIKGKGTFTYPEVSTDIEANGYSGVTSKSYGIWEIASDVADYAYTLQDINVRLGSPNASGKGELIDLSTGGQSGNYARLMYLIPQKVDALTSENSKGGAYVKVTAKMVMDSMRGNDLIAEKIIPISIDWQEGGIYNLHISWEPTLISFSTSIDDYIGVSVIQN